MDKVRVDVAKSIRAEGEFEFKITASPELKDWVIKFMNYVFNAEMFSSEIVENKSEVIVKIITGNKKKIEIIKKYFLSALREKSKLGNINFN